MFARLLRKTYFNNIDPRFSYKELKIVGWDLISPLLPDHVWRVADRCLFIFRLPVQGKDDHTPSDTCFPLCHISICMYYIYIHVYFCSFEQIIIQRYFKSAIGQFSHDFSFFTAEFWIKFRNTFYETNTRVHFSYFMQYFNDPTVIIRCSESRLTNKISVYSKYNENIIVERML